MNRTFSVTEIGVARTPLLHRRDAPFQPGGQPGAVKGTVEVSEAYAPALQDLEGFERIWLLYVFDRNEGYRLTVKPPRGNKKRGLFATRSPHRPSPIGLTCARLLEVKGRVLVIEGLDLLDGTPIIDIKPYLPFADAHPGARIGWLEELSDGLEAEREGEGEKDEQERA